MKRISLLRNLGLITGASLTLAPVVLASASCSKMTSYYCDVFDYNSIVANVSAASVKNTKLTFNQLLYGSMKNYDGNYLLFIGSVTDSSVNSFFCSADKANRSLWYSDENFPYSPFCRAIIKASTNEDARKEGMTNFGIYFFIDFFDFTFKDKKGHRIYISENAEHGFKEKVKPYDKWTDALITQTKNYNRMYNDGYEWDETSVKAGEYIRNDDYAVAYRAINQRGAELYPKTDKRKDTFDATSGAPRMVTFKNGKLQTIENIPGTSDSDIEAVAKKWVASFKIAKDEKKS